MGWRVLAVRAYWNGHARPPSVRIDGTTKVDTLDNHTHTYSLYFSGRPTMADLYNLLDEIKDAEADDNNNDQTARRGETLEQQEEERDWDDTDAPREQIELPNIRSSRFDEDGSIGHGDDPHDEPDFALEDVGESSSLAEDALLAELPYTKLKTWWQQERQSPELLPYNEELLQGLIRSVEERLEMENAELSSNPNLQALFASLVRMDTERVQYVVTDLLRTRLEKIEKHPLYMRRMADRMSVAEVSKYTFLNHTAMTNSR